MVPFGVSHLPTITMRFAQISTTREQAFVVEIEQISSLIAILSDFASTVEIEVSRADDLTVSLEDVSALRAQENPFERRILAMKLSAPSGQADETSNRASVELSCFPGRGLSDPRAEIRIYGPEKEATATKGALLEVVDGTRPWYSRMSNEDSLLIFLAPFALLMFLALTYTDQAMRFAPGDPMSLAAAILVALVAFVAALLAIVSCLQKLCTWLFPKRVFLIGQEEKRHKRRLYWHKALAALLASAGLALLV